MPDLPRNRQDHFVPQGYLRGFIDPARSNQDRPLWCLSRARNQWERKSTRQICSRRGFYDFATDPVNVEHPDVTFKSMENGFPALRDDLQRRNFVGWEEHIAFLLAYMQMIRARSPQFFVDQGQALANAKMARVVALNRTDQSLTHDGLRPLTDDEKHDFTIGYMREEIKKGAAWMEGFHWQLRTTFDPRNPVVTSEAPLFVKGDGPVARETMTMDVLTRKTSLVYFPLCWQACLVGRTRPFESDLEPFEQGDLADFRRMMAEMAPDYVISPHVVKGLLFMGRPVPKIHKRG